MHSYDIGLIARNVLVDRVQYEHVVLCMFTVCYEDSCVIKLDIGDGYFQETQSSKPTGKIGAAKAWKQGRKPRPVPSGKYCQMAIYGRQTYAEAKSAVALTYMVIAWDRLPHSCSRTLSSMLLDDALFLRVDWTIACFNRRCTKQYIY